MTFNLWCSWLSSIRRYHQLPLPSYNGEEQVQVLNTRVLEHSQELELKKQELSKTQSDLQQKNEELQKKIQCPYTQTFVYPLTVINLALVSPVATLKVACLWSKQPTQYLSVRSCTSVSGAELLSLLAMQENMLILQPHITRWCYMTAGLTD